jgi:hypothetical protein
VSKFLCVPGIHPKNPQVAYTFWTVSIVVMGAVAATDTTAIAASNNKKMDLVIIVTITTAMMTTGQTIAIFSVL